MNGFDYYSKGLTTYATFKGRASRKEFWYFVLFSFLMFFSIMVFGAINESEELIAIIGGLFAMATFLPLWAVGARRLHDMGQSAWLLLLGIIPPGLVALIILFCIKSQPHPNKWGRTPSALEEEEWEDEEDFLEDFEFRKSPRRRDDYV